MAEKLTGKNEMYLERCTSVVLSQILFQILFCLISI